MNDECSLSADDHYDYACFVLDMFGKNWSNVVALVGDNCSTNGAFSARSKVPLIGCSSHRFNLAVNDILVNYEPILSDVHTLMTKLKNLIPAAKLRAFTPLQAVTRNKNRWSSTFAMLERYVAIRGSIGQIIDRDIQNLALSPRQDNKVDELLVILADLNTVTLALQCDDLTMQGVRDHFDTVLEDHPGMTSRLACNSKNVKNPDFEVGVVKILAGRESSLTPGEKKCVASLLRPTNPASGKTVESLTLDQRAKKRAKPGESLYVDCRFL
ncbi:hypothetical protein DYB32_010473 [Aphanomyces invadans]|uniref:Uncharacterized protein n=1 Tax=Aphanomyces invadans TaxID=157072 RepID=A0A3R6VDT5_9STRA|nr:hypothetical protein DYB32_010473 [Aphanomyces invadans]